MFGIIYKIKNIFTGKKYIGQTVKTLDSRKKEHKTNVIKGTGHYIHNSMRKHGIVYDIDFFRISLFGWNDYCYICIDYCSVPNIYFFTFSTTPSKTLIFNLKIN